MLVTVAHLNKAAFFNFSTYLFLSQELFQAWERTIDVRCVCPYFLWLFSCRIFTSRLGALLDILFAKSLGLFPEVFDVSLISDFSKLFIVFRLFLLIVLYEFGNSSYKIGKGRVRIQGHIQGYFYEFPSFTQIFILDKIYKYFWWIFQFQDYVTFASTT